jgi:hypothetical protein
MGRNEEHAIFHGNQDYLMRMRGGWFLCSVNQIFPSVMSSDKVTPDSKAWDGEE